MHVMGAPDDPSPLAEEAEWEQSAARRDGFTVRVSGQLTLTATRLTVVVAVVLSLAGLHL